MNKQVKVVKINEALTTICDGNNPKKYKGEIKSRKSKYDQILESTQRIKNLIKNKYKTRKSNDESNNYRDNETNVNKKPDDAFKNQFKKPLKKKFTKTQKRSKIKQKVMDNQTIEQIFKELRKSRLKNNNITNKEDLLAIFRNILNTNNIYLTNKFIKKINIKQTNLILYFLGIIKSNSTAPLPLLKNILYNFLTSNIIIIKL